MQLGVRLCLKRSLVHLTYRVMISEKLEKILSLTRTDIVLFNKYILQDEDPEPWKVILRKFFDPENNYMELVMIIGRKGGKSVRAAKIALFFVYKIVSNPDFFKQHNIRIVPGQPIYILVVSVTKDQAQGIIIQYARSFAKRSWYLKHFLAPGRSKKSEVKFEGNIIVKAQGSSSTAMRGYPCVVVIFDELGHFVDTTGRMSGTACYNSLTPNIADYGDVGKIIVLSTPGAKSGILWDLYQWDKGGKTPRTFLVKKPTWEMRPNISKYFLETEKNKNPYVFQCEYGAEFYEVIDAFLNPRKIDGCFVGGENQLTWTPGPWDYFIAMDPATKHNSYSVVLAHMEGTQPVIDYITKFEPVKGKPVQISEVEDHVREICDAYPVLKLGIDQHQSASTIQKFKKEGLPIEETPFTAQYIMVIYERLRRFIHGRGKNKAVLPMCPPAAKQLKMLQIRHTGHRFTVGAPRGYDDDIPDALANVIYMMTKDIITGELL